MRLLLVAIAGCLLGLMSGCAPTFNWREAAIGDTRLLAMFPCKPELQQRTVDLAEQSVELAMRSCDTDGVTLAVGHARLADPQLAAGVLVHWRDAMLAGMRVDPASISTLPPPRLQTLPQLLATRGNGKAPKGHALVVHGLWFAQGPDVFMAILYAGSLTPESTEPFFSGLRFR